MSNMVGVIDYLRHILGSCPELSSRETACLFYIFVQSIYDILVCITTSLPILTLVLIWADFPVLGLFEIRVRVLYS